MKHLAILLILASLFLTSCSKKVKKTDEHDHSVMKKSEQVSDTDMTKDTKKSALLTDLIDAYLQVKNALVATDQDATAKSAEIMLVAYANLPTDKLTETQHKSFKDIYENSKEQLEHIVKSPMDHQREHFLSLSADTNDLIALIGTDRPLYKEFCPMYKKKGGMWLSASNKIRNPYFGSKMLKCGKVLEEI